MEKIEKEDQIQISNLMEEILSQTPAVGAALVAGSKEQIYYKGYFGSIHKSSNIEVSENTLFDIQSITKVVATSSLLEVFYLQGKIGLNDHVQKYVPDFQPKRISDIKIIDLLLHQSGISDEDFNKEYSDPEELWNAMFNAPLHFLPGTSVEYTDVGYRILGLCLERIGGQSLDTLCKNFVWEPLGMNDTTYDISSTSIERIAGHGNAWGIIDDVQDRLLEKPVGCDGVFSTATDLALFCRHFLSKLSIQNNSLGFLSTNSGRTNANWSSYESLGLGRKVFGWEQHTSKQSYIGSRHSIGTLEKAGGAGAFIALRPETQDFIIYLTNHGRPDPFTMESWNSLVERLKVSTLAERVLKQ